MSDISPRSPMGASRLLTDALLRSVGGSTALFRVTGVNTTSGRSELGLVSTTFYDAAVGPVVMRRLRPGWQSDGSIKWELLVSAAGVEKQVIALELSSAEALFALTLVVTVSEKEYLIESISSNEAFGQVYMYRLLMRET